MSFKAYVEEILQNEVLSVVRQQGAGASLFCIE